MAQGLAVISLHVSVLCLLRAHRVDAVGHSLRLEHGGQVVLALVTLEFVDVFLSLPVPVGLCPLCDLLFGDW